MQRGGHEARVSQGGGSGEGGEGDEGEGEGGGGEGGEGVGGEGEGPPISQVVSIISLRAGTRDSSGARLNEVAHRRRYPSVGRCQQRGRRLRAKPPSAPRRLLADKFQLQQPSSNQI